MNLFYVIEDAVAIVRKPRGVYSQTKMYRRGDQLYIAYGSGFLRLTAKFGDTWGTSHPDIRVIDFDCPGATGTTQPRFDAEPSQGLRVAA